MEQKTENYLEKQSNLNNKIIDIAPLDRNNLDYYSNIASRVVDFIIGFFGPIVLYALYSMVYSVYFNSPINYFFQSVLPFILMILAIGLAIYFFFNGRKFIGIGIVSLMLIPVIFYAFFWR